MDGNTSSAICNRTGFVLSVEQKVLGKKTEKIVGSGSEW